MSNPFYKNGQWLWEKHYPPGVNWHIPLSREPLQHIMEYAQEMYPDNCLCVFEGKEYTYREIGEMIDKVAKGLQDLGVRKGKKVGLMLPNTPHYIIFFYAVLTAGGTVVNYNPLYVEHELKHQVEDSETDIIVTLNLEIFTGKLKHTLENTRLKNVIVCKMQEALPFPKNLLFPLAHWPRISKDLSDKRFLKFKDVLGNNGQYEPVKVDPENDIAVLQYTGGTTGVPKGAMLTHSNLFINVQQGMHWMKEIEPGKNTIIAVLPFFHVFALTVNLNLPLWAGMRIILQPKFELENLLKAIETYKPDFMPAVPAIYNAIATRPGVENIDFSSLQFCISGGAPLSKEVKDAFEQKTKCKALAEGYGLTETSPAVAFNPTNGKAKAGSVGLPFPGTVVEIVGKEDKTTLLSVGEIGEVCIRGPQIMKGYFNKPDATAEVIRGGRLHTGDVGYLDEEGYLFLVDRIKDMITVRGYKVFPRFVEDAVYKNDKVEECIVAGVPDEERGQTVWAWIKPKEGHPLTAEELEAFLKDKLSPIEMPRKFIIRDAPLPKTAVGKLSKKLLLEEEGITQSIK